MTRSIYAMPGVLGLLLFDPMQYFSWWIYVGVGVVYTALVFCGELSKEGTLIFSKQNARSLLEIFTVHLAFLAILLGLMRTGPHIYRFLPNWLTDTFNARGSSVSVLDIVFILLMIAAHYAERRCLYVDSEIDTSCPN
jgi:hypothetical protein